MVTLFKKNLRLRSKWALIALAILVFVLLAVVICKIDSAGTGVNAAELVRAVRESENWIHQCDSLLIRVDSNWTNTQHKIAAYRKELKEEFYHDLEPDPNRHWGLKPSHRGNLEYGIEQPTADQRRLRRLHDVPGRRRVLTIWNGQERLFYERYFTHKQESYSIGNDPNKIISGLFVGLSWPRAQPHSFWWDQVDIEENLTRWGRVEDFRFKGRAKYRGVDCYVLECKPPALTGRVRRWYVGTKDHLLYGNLLLSLGRTIGQHWTLDYKEVADGCWYPMTQGYELYDEQWWGKVYLNSRRDLKVVEIRVNEQLPDDLFQMEFKEGVRVVDWRFGGVVTYPYKAERTEQEWREIRERARERAERDEAEKTFKDALIGKPAPAFPENATWLNSEPLTFEDLRGKVIILDFWADWCGPCKNDLPLMAGLHKQRKKSGIVAIGLHTPGSKLEDIRKVMEQYKLDYPNCIDTPKPPDGKGFGAMSSKYGVDGIPYSFVID
ncbi:MAG: redoxin domain-containing protein, partial [Planctomycetota bacterium]